MSRDSILTAVDGTRYSLSNIRTQGWLEGHASGLDAAVAFLNERAVALFRNRKDDQAMATRVLADELAKLRPDMEARAKRHDHEHPMIIDDENEDANA